MPRPLRIEFENAYYHVMNKGRGRQKIFPSTEYYEIFLSTLAETHQRFGVEILSYCLMPDQYHLLIKTPEGNLGRAMRHINGVFTQRHNRLKKTDGTLFRGRYKAICLEEKGYPLELSRYIHRIPLKPKLVDRLEDYQWSSYPYYVSAKKPPNWLNLKEIYDQLQAKSNRRKKYQSFTEQGVDEELKQFYGKGNVSPYLGSEEFRSWAYSQRLTDDPGVSKKSTLGFRPSIEVLIDRVARAFKVTPETIFKVKRGKVPRNLPRSVGMYLCQEVGGYKLIEIAEAFGLKKYGSISNTVKNLKDEMEIDIGLRKKIKRLI